MRKLLVLAAFVALVTGAAVAPAHAVIVQLWTEASLNGGPFSTNPSLTLWPGIGGLEFHGLTGDFVDTALGAFSLGSLKVNGPYGATYGTTPDPLPFTIKVTQQSHSLSSDTFDGAISGSFGGSWSTMMVTLMDDMVALDGYLYKVHEMDDPLHFSPQSVDAVVTPEPSTLLLVGTGLSGLAGAVRRKISRRKNG